MSTAKNVWKPTQAECDALKRAAAAESLPRLTVGQLRLEPGWRINLDDESVPASLNIALVTKHLDEGWEDTDLMTCGCWETFRKGVPLDEEGCAVVDFYIRARTEAIEDKFGGDSLFGNVTAYYANGKLERIAGTTDDYPVN